MDLKEKVYCKDCAFCTDADDISCYIINKYTGTLEEPNLIKAYENKTGDCTTFKKKIIY